MAKDFTVQLEDLLEDMNEKVKEVVEKSAEDSAKECARKLRSSSPKGPEGYAQSWTAREVNGGWVTYNKDHYQLTHLLENSHVIKNGRGRYGETYPGHGQVIHIEPVANEGVEGFELRLNRGLNEV